MDFFNGTFLQICDGKENEETGTICFEVGSPIKTWNKDGMTLSKN